MGTRIQHCTKLTVRGSQRRAVIFEVKGQVSTKRAGYRAQPWGGGTSVRGETARTQGAARGAGGEETGGGGKEGVGGQE